MALVYGLSLMTVTVTETGTSCVQVNCQTPTKTLYALVNSEILVGNQDPPSGPVIMVGIETSNVQPVVVGLVKVMVKSDWHVCVNVTVGSVVVMMFAIHCLAVSRVVVIEVDRSTV